MWRAIRSVIDKRHLLVKNEHFLRRSKKKIVRKVSGTTQRGEGRLAAIGGFPLVFPKEIWHYPRFMDEETTERKERWLKSLIANGDDRGLDAAAYLVVIQALASSGGTCSGSAQKAEEWIVALKRHHRGSGNENLAPTVECYNSVICAWARSKEPVAAVRAERWLNELRKAKAPRNATGNEPGHSIRLGPNTDSYNFFLMCVSKGEAQLTKYFWSCYGTSSFNAPKSSHCCR